MELFLWVFGNQITFPKAIQIGHTVSIILCAFPSPFLLFFTKPSTKNLHHQQSLKSSNLHIIYLTVFQSTIFFLSQSGCCKPPTYCGFEFKNATFWVVPKTGPAVADTDCKTWSNDQKQLCFDCKSCRAGLLANIKSQWRTLAICNACIFVVLIFVYSVGCCAFRNNRRDKYKYQRGFP